MRKLFSLFAAALLTLTANATILNIAPDSPQASDNIRREIRDHIQAGDTLMLADGVYTEADVVELSKDVVIMAAEGAKPIVKQQYYMKMLNSAKVTIIGVKFDGSLYPASDHCIRPYDATEGKTLTLIDCEFTNYPNGYIVYPQKADRCMQTLTIKNCLFENFGRSAIYVETGSSTLPLAEANIENSTFMATTPDSHRVIDIKNDGSEVADAKLRIDHCTFYNCNTVRSEKSTDVIVSNSIFAAPEGATYAATTFYAGAAINNCLTFNVAHTDGPTVTAPVVADPLFVNAAEGNLNLGEGSPALTAAADGGAIGDPRWVPAAPVSSDLTLYLRLSADWAGWPARYAIYTWKEGVGDKWVAMTAVDGENNLYTAAIPADNDKLIFVRLNGETTGLTWEDKWSQTVDLDFPEGENNLFTVTAGGTGSECTGVWSVYGAPYVPQHADGYYLVGKFGGVETWGVTEERAMTLNTEAVHEEYMITVTLAEGDEFKVVKSENDNITWYPNEGDNYVVDANHAGEKTIYFRPDGLGDEAFYQGVIYVAPNVATAIDNAEMGEKAVKMIENGQLIIIKNGVKFNAQGAVVR